MALANRSPEESLASVAGSGSVVLAGRPVAANGAPSDRGRAVAVARRAAVRQAVGALRADPAPVARRRRRTRAVHARRRRRNHRTGWRHRQLQSASVRHCKKSEAQ